MSGFRSVVDSGEFKTGDTTCLVAKNEYWLFRGRNNAYRFNRRYDLAALPQRLLQAAAVALPLPRPLAMCAAAA